MAAAALRHRPVLARGDGPLRVAVLTGIHSILLGFDYRIDEPARRDFLGFAVHRSDLTEEEGWWLKGQIRFRQDAGDLGEDVSTNRAPLQKFHWGDYTAKPGHHYRYRVHAVHGRPGALRLSEPVELDLLSGSNSGRRVKIYFNRGVTASRAYRIRFGDVAPRDVPNGAALQWLSRGLEEALLAFIAAARAGDQLKVAIYEFEHPAIVAALRAAQERGVELSIVYHARAGDSQTTENTFRIDSMRSLPGVFVARTRVPNISHNKFIVHCRNHVPEAVWTGSTNFTDSGIYLQTNVGLVFRERAAAAAFERYFTLLAGDLASGPMRLETEAALAGFGSIVGGTPFFSPVRGRAFLDVARQIISEARRAILISCPFGLDRSIVDALNANAGEIIEYGLVNTSSAGRFLEMIDRTANTWYATPAWLPEYDGRIWDAKAYGGHKIHVKSIVVDPWSPRAKVLIGSANFSDESVNRNDENALLVEGDRRLAAVCATEFLRMFDHYKFRNYVKRAEALPMERYLAEDGSWADDYYDPRHAKYLDRLVFAGR